MSATCFYFFLYLGSRGSIFYFNDGVSVFFTILTVVDTAAGNNIRHQQRPLQTTLHTVEVEVKENIFILTVIVVYSHSFTFHNANKNNHFLSLVEGFQ